MPESQQYKEAATKFIKQQMVMLGPNVAISTARRVKGLIIDDEGTVKSLECDPFSAWKELINIFNTLSSFVTQVAVSRIEKDFPDIKSAKS